MTVWQSRRSLWQSRVSNYIDSLSGYPDSLSDWMSKRRRYWSHRLCESRTFEEIWDISRCTFGVSGTFRNERMATLIKPNIFFSAHKNVKAFITHCGISGTYEAISEGVPLVLASLFGDQGSNAAFLQQLEVGVYLDAFEANTETILDALNTVLNDSR